MEILEECWDDAIQEVEEPESQLLELSLFSFLGIDSPTTTKVRGTVGTTSMVVLIDSGATHNFVTPMFIKKARLQMIVNPNLQILLGTGILVNGMGVCRDIHIELQGLKFVIDCISLELGGVDMVLGVQWLRTLGKCEVDWDSHEWSFKHEDKTVTLLGESDLLLPKSYLQTLFTAVTESEKGMGHCFIITTMKILLFCWYRLY